MIRLTFKNIGSIRAILRIALLFFAFLLVSNNVVSNYMNLYEMEEIELSEEESEESSENLEEITDTDEFLNKEFDYMFITEMDWRTKERHLYGWANPDTEIHTPPPEYLFI